MEVMTKKDMLEEMEREKEKKRAIIDYNAIFEAGVASEKNRVCKWTYKYYPERYETECGQTLKITDEDPDHYDDGTHCRYCGGKIEEES
jgi:hypothetical protein